MKDLLDEFWMPCGRAWQRVVEAVRLPWILNCCIVMNCVLVDANPVADALILMGAQFRVDPFP